MFDTCSNLFFYGNTIFFSQNNGLFVTAFGLWHKNSAQLSITFINSEPFFAFKVIATVNDIKV